MNIDVPEVGPVKVSFEYEPFVKGRVDQRFTIARVQLIKLEGQPVYTGRAYKTRTDNFCRRVGRKLALARALNGAGLKQSDRKAVWEGLVAKGFKLE